MNLFFKPFVESIISLCKNGLDISFEGKKQNYKVGLHGFLADNLGAHLIGGFKESMSFAYRICRTCMATTAQIQTSFLESQFKLRTATERMQQVKSLNDGTSIEYGINHPSELDKIRSISVAQNLPHDIIHDLFEGVVQYEMKLVILKVKQSASKIWLHVVTLPLIIGDFIPELCLEWVLYMLLLRICSIAC